MELKELYTAHREFINVVHQQISIADDRFQRNRASEYKYVFGMLRGALVSKAIPYILYNDLYNMVWEDYANGDAEDKQDPEQSEMEIDQ